MARLSVAIIPSGDTAMEGNPRMVWCIGVDGCHSVSGENVIMPGFGRCYPGQLGKADRVQKSGCPESCWGKRKGASRGLRAEDGPRKELGYCQHKGGGRHCSKPSLVSCRDHDLYISCRTYVSRSGRTCLDPPFPLNSLANLSQTVGMRTTFPQNGCILSSASAPPAPSPRHRPST